MAAPAGNSIGRETRPLQEIAARNAERISRNLSRHFASHPIVQPPSGGGKSTKVPGKERRRRVVSFESLPKPYPCARPKSSAARAAATRGISSDGQTGIHDALARHGHTSGAANARARLRRLWYNARQVKRLLCPAWMIGAAPVSVLERPR